MVRGWFGGGSGVCRGWFGGVSGVGRGDSAGVASLSLHKRYSDRFATLIVRFYAIFNTLLNHISTLLKSGLKLYPHRFMTLLEEVCHFTHERFTTLLTYSYSLFSTKMYI